MDWYLFFIFTYAKQLTNTNTTLLIKLFLHVAEKKATNKTLY